MTTFTTIERAIDIHAPAAEIATYLADLRQWADWSPWEGQDPNLQRTYGGTPAEVGSTYSWNGNRKAGAGSMVVTQVEPREIHIDLKFTAPFKSSSEAVFLLTETGATTRLVWSMTSPNNAMARVMRIVINMDKLIGGDFEKGLARLKNVIESK